jgi:hypothetical protein
MGMAHTKEQRDENPLCNSLKKNGERCRMFAGAGTSHPGIGACKWHFGNAKNHEKAAVKRELTQRMVMMGAPAENVTALDALLQELYASTGHVGWLRQQIADLSQDELGMPYGQTLLNMYAGERDRKAKIARLAIESGVDEAAIRVAEAQLTALGTALSRACDTAGVSPKLRKAIGSALREHLSEIEAQPNLLMAAPVA